MPFIFLRVVLIIFTIIFFFSIALSVLERLQAYYDNFNALVAIYSRYNAQERLGCLKRSLNDIEINI